MTPSKRGRHELRYGLYLPNFGKQASARMYVELAKEAEKNGWNGFFLWDHILEWDKHIPLFDTYSILAAIAVNTKSIRVGTSVSPLPRYKPWNLARRIATIDHLSAGRMILGVGLGVEESSDYRRFGESPEPRVLAEKLDESLEIIAGLCTGRKFSYHSGRHYKIERETTFLPPPVQKPRIPIWTGGNWPNKGPFRRAAKWDGIIPLKAPGKLLQPSDLKEIMAFVSEQRNDMNNFDVAVIGWTAGKDARRDSDKISSFAKAGATWWLESLYTKRDSEEKLFERIRAGPPSN